jgi:3-hydroxyisobutyrate dehydrogenase
MSLGFMGLGHMGSPMAANLARAGLPLTVWNRTPGRDAPLAREGAHVAATPDELFARSDTVLLMLADGAAIDAVLDRAGPRFAARVGGRLIVPMGTMAPDYSRRLAADIRAAGGRYVEAPVSGSRKPAEAGQLVAMLAGAKEDFSALRPVLAPLCRQTVYCGPVPNGLVMKLAVNIFLLATVTGLAESVHFAQAHGLDLGSLATVLNQGQMASDISRLKIAKLVERDFAPHAAIADVAKNGRLITEAARAAGAATPLLAACDALYRETVALGHGADDMAAVLLALEARNTA